MRNIRSMRESSEIIYRLIFVYLTVIIMRKRKIRICKIGCYDKYTVVGFVGRTKGSRIMQINEIKELIDI